MNTKLRFAAQQYRSLPSPNGSGKVGVFYAKAHSVPPELSEWLAVNPREVKTTSKVYRDILSTLNDESDRFAERNRGLTISAKDIEFDEKRREVVLHLDDRTLHGVVDGGHTLSAIIEAQPEKDSSWDAEVFVKVLTGVAPDRIAEIAGGLNTSQQVDLRSLENLKSHFDRLQKVLSDKPYANDIAYKMNQERDVDVREVLLYLAVFDCTEYSDVKHPSGVFGRKEGIVRKFAEQAKRRGGSFDILITRAPEILELRDMIEKATIPIVPGRVKAGKNERVKSPKHKKNRLIFLGETVEGKISLGWIMPMLGAFRANVEWDRPAGSFTWRVPNEQLVQTCIKSLFEGIYEIHKNENSRPEYVARNATSWRVCYERVKNAVLEHQLAEASRR